MSATYSFDASLCGNMFTIPWTLGLRWECDWYIPVYYVTPFVIERTYIYLTNYDVYSIEMQEFLEREENNYLTDKGERESHYPWGRGIQFTTRINDGYLFRSHTYVPGTIRGGGYSKYPLK